MPGMRHPCLPAPVPLSWLRRRGQQHTRAAPADRHRLHGHDHPRPGARFVVSVHTGGRASSMASTSARWRQSRTPCSRTSRSMSPAAWSFARWPHGAASRTTATPSPPAGARNAAASRHRRRGYDALRRALRVGDQGTGAHGGLRNGIERRPRTGARQTSRRHGSESWPRPTDSLGHFGRQLRSPRHSRHQGGNACATGQDALRNAVFGVASGYVDVALVVGADKVRETSARSTFWDWMAMTRDMAWDYPLGLVAPANFALHVRRYLHEAPATGSTSR